MTDKEMRELDCYLAEHVFKIRVIKKKFPNHKNSWGYKLSDGKDEWPNANGLYGWGWSHDEDGARFHTPHYTIDPAAAMLVLKACAQKMSPDGGGSAPVIEWLGDVEEKWRVVESDRFDGIKSEASTLELAIALFAKKLHAQEKETKVH